MIAECGVKPIEWLQMLRDDPEVMGIRAAVLMMLGLRMEGKGTSKRPIGTGYCPVSRIVADAGVSKSTVLRELRWATRRGYLVQTKRGHRLGNGEGQASEWRLSQGVTPDTLSGDLKVSPATPREPVDNSPDDGLKVSQTSSQGVTPGTPRELSNKRSSYIPQTNHRPRARRTEPTYADDRDAVPLADAVNGLAHQLGGGRQ